MTYGIPFYLLANNWLQFISKFLKTLCIFIGARRLTTTHYLQKIEHANRYNCIIVPKQLHYVLEQHRDWDKYVQPVTYAYSAQTLRASESSAFNVVMPLEPPSAAMSNRIIGTAWNRQRDTHSWHTNQRLREYEESMETAVERRIAATRKKHKKVYSKKLGQEPQIHVSDKGYMHYPQQSAFLSGSAEMFASHGFNKLIRRMGRLSMVTRLRCTLSWLSRTPH